MSTNASNPTTFSENLPESSFEEGGYVRVREMFGRQADLIRQMFDVTDGTSVIMTEYQVYGGMFEPEGPDEFDLIVTCGEHRKGFSETRPKMNEIHLMKWLTGTEEI